MLSIRMVAVPFAAALALPLGAALHGSPPSAVEPPPARTVAAAVPEVAPPVATAQPGSRVTRVYTRIARVDLATYTAVSTDAVRGHVVALRPVFPESGLGYTEVTFAVEEAIFGAAPEVIQVRVGGAVGLGRETVVDGAPRFRVGDEVLLFLRRYDDFYGINGLGDGTYRVDYDAQGVARVAGLHAGRNESLQGFEERVRSLANRAHGRSASEEGGNR